MYVKFQDLEEEQQNRLKCYTLPLPQTKGVISQREANSEENSVITKKNGHQTLFYLFSNPNCFSHFLFLKVRDCCLLRCYMSRSLVIYLYNYPLASSARLNYVN